MATVQWKPSGRSGGAVETIMDTELNSLGAGSGVTSSAVSNDAADELDLFMDMELYVNDFSSAPTDGDRIDVYVYRTVDGTNYLEDETPPNYVGSFVVEGVATTQRMPLCMIPAPPDDFKVRIVNNSTAFDAAGHTLKALFYTYQVG
jgi:hypothetical protein